MERPSHIAFRTPHISRRLPLFALAVFLQAGAIALIMTGLGHYKPDVIHDFLFVPDTKPPTIDKMLPPPEPVIVDRLPAPPNPIVDNFTIDRGPGTISVQPPKTNDPPQVPPVQPPSAPDHAAVAITSTHTIPPYPPIAVRQGLEGKVMLKLTISENGRVAKAEVVTSSGSEALDQAALAWIQSHWAYRPAQDHGQPVASQAMANVTFNLKDAR